ncbi:hypothetical protein CRENBAI_012066 [Crenichthys baileyi]|uniref:Uncharacterized protein n=1 Tax=Crenichthys baileyi TaxID=28760 RepID=A0AAV9RFN1_9TELE
MKTTNPKHTPSIRNHPADKQTPPQYKTEKTDATAERSNALQHPTLRPKPPRSGPPQHIIQRRTERSKEHPKQNPCTKPTPCKCTPTSPPKIKPLHEIARPVKRGPTASRSKNMPDTHSPARSSPARRPHTKAHKRRRAHRAKTKTHREAENSPPRDQSGQPAR